MVDLNESDDAPKRKMSEMISEIGAGFISVGKTLAERQNRLTAVCSAWNMACVSPENRQRQLEEYKEVHVRFNPETSPTDLAKILKVMESLIERKLKMFPEDHRQIVDAKVVPVGASFRIEVVTASLP
jgi:hypothetical protein